MKKSEVKKLDKNVVDIKTLIKYYKVRIKRFKYLIKSIENGESNFDSLGDKDQQIHWVQGRLDLMKVLLAETGDPGFMNVYITNEKSQRHAVRRNKNYKNMNQEFDNGI